MDARILIVDDNADLAAILGELLRIAGHDTEVARNGAEALACLDDGVFDLILCDVTMPELDGEGVYRALHQHHPEYVDRVVFMTGHHDPARLAFVEAAGVPLLRKPFSLTDLAPAIGQAIAARERLAPAPAP